MSTYHVSKRTVEEIAAYLNQSHFDFFTGYPSAMYALASFIEELGLRVRNPPKCIVSGSDALLPNYQETLGRVFAAPVTEQYGMAEFAGNLSKCPDGSLHEDFECCYVETRPLSDCDRSALLLTGWGNPSMPFIRYEIGDYGRLSEYSCSCGRKSRCFSGIEGRLEDYIVTPDGRRLIGMNQVFEYATNAREVQICQVEPSEVEFRIVPKVGFGDQDCRRSSETAPAGSW